MDNPCGLSSDDLLATLTKYGQLTAHEIAHICKVSLKQVLCAIHHDWFAVQPITWDGPGWKYALRATLSRRVNKPSEKVKHYENDRGTIRSGDFS